MKTKHHLVLYIYLLTATLYGCNKSNDLTPDNQDNTIQKQIVNTKWYYDSTVFWHDAIGFDTYQSLDRKSYVYFSSDSVFSEFKWTGVTYDKTDYPYTFFDNGRINCDYFFANNLPVIKNNQLVMGDVNTLPRETNLTGQVELVWDFYHK